MKDMYTIAMPYFTRSEWGPLAPLVDVMALSDRLSVRPIGLEIREYERFNAAWGEVMSLRPDMVICGFDRPEMAPLAYEAYHQGVPVAQIFAGDIAGGAFDDRDRYAISNYADLLFCADEPQYKRVKRALDWRSKVEDRPEIHISGATHFDDMVFIPPEDVKGPFELVLYNAPTPYDTDEILQDLQYIAISLLLRCIKKNGKIKKRIVWVESNDKKIFQACKVAAEEWDLDKYIIWKEDMPRERFLGYVHECDGFIGTSSSMFYEGVYFDKPIQQWGRRNRYRERISKEMCRPGASKLICQKIVEFLDRRKEHGNAE